MTSCNQSQKEGLKRPHISAATLYFMPLATSFLYNSDAISTFVMPD